MFNDLEKKNFIEYQSIENEIAFVQHGVVSQPVLNIPNKSLKN
jgi:hypothetical protein